MGKRKKARTSSQTLSKMLADLRQERKLSLKSLAKAAGVSAAYICRLESGERHPSRDLLLGLIDILMPTASQADKDKLMVAAGFAPVNYRNYMGRESVISLYEALCQRHPEDFKNLNALVMLYLRNNRHADALNKIKAGQQQFSNPVQSLVLMAATALSGQDYPEAVKLQTQAIEAFKQDGAQQGLQLYDLYFSRGLIYFESGTHKAYAYQNAKINNDKASSHLNDALAQLDLAEKDFQTALQMQEDVYVLDELARLYFTMAYLQDDKLAPALWEKSVKAFEKTICSSDKEVLGYQSLIQSTCFLALTYIKTRDFQRAWFTLNIVEACLPNYWLLHYMKAIYFVLSDTGNSSRAENLDQALNCLKRAAAIDDPHNRTLTEAQLDLDFQCLRQERGADFKAFLKGEQ